MIEAGKILQERYRVERQIGQGGMGAVYIATDERFGSTVAIKETFFTDEKFRKAFEREARLLNSLRHPALPRVSDHFIEGNGQFLVMEYIDGDDLSEQIEQEGHAFAVGDVLDWADQLLDALDYLHSQAMPVIHRDIKPQNLKLTSKGQVVLLDFGLAKGNATNPESATAAKSVFGYSRNYASLEQIQGTGTDPRSDLYSLAATLYHLLAGNPPVDALTRAMNVLSDKKDPSLPITTVRPEVPAAVSDVLERAMSLNANERPASASEMRRMLSAAANGEVYSAPATFVERAPETNLFTQMTQLQTDASESKKHSEMKTESFSDPVSKETRLKTSPRTGDLAPAAGDSEKAVPNRRAAAIGAAIGGLLLLGVAAGAVYIYRPAVQEPKPLSETNAANMNVVANTEIGNSNAAHESNTASVPSPTVQAKTEPGRDDPKTVTQKTPDPTGAQTQVDAQPVTTPPERRGEPVAGERPMPPPPDELGPPPRDPRTNQVIPPDVWRKMTPVQRKKLRRALEMQREMQNRPPDPNNNN